MPVLQDDTVSSGVTAPMPKKVYLDDNGNPIAQAPPTTPPPLAQPPGMMDKLLQMIGYNPQQITGAGVVTGALKNLGGTIASQAIPPVPGNPSVGTIIDAASRMAFPGSTSTVQQTMSPSNPSEELGSRAATVAQLAAIPIGGAVGGVRGMMAARAGGMAAREAAMAAAREAGAASESALGKVADLQSMADKLKRMAAAKSGLKLTAQDELAAALKEVEAAKAKGVAPGFGWVPKSVSQRVDAATTAAKQALDEESGAAQTVRETMDQLADARAASVKLKLRAEALEKAQAAMAKGEKGGITSAMLKSVLGAGMHGTAWEIGRELIRAIGGVR